MGSSRKAFFSVERVAHTGEGIALEGGKVFFVEGALPGEVVEAQIIEEKSRYGRARIIRWIDKSPSRETAVCPLFGRCGGCQLMHMSYPAQLLFKQNKVKEALARIGKIQEVHIEPCTPSPQSLHYRNKIQMPIYWPSNQRAVIGLYAVRSHQLVPVDQCYIHCEEGESSLAVMKQDLPLLPASTKHLLIRTAARTQQQQAIVVTSRRENLTSLAEKWMKKIPILRGVIQNINSSQGNTVLGDDCHVVAGTSTIEEEICQIRFQMLASSFFQVNVEQAEVLYTYILHLCDLQGGERVLDAYCGVGVLSLLIARRAKYCIGIEVNPQAIQAAISNQLAHQLDNVEFICAPVEKISLPAVDIAIVNPPRKGCDPDVIQRLIDIHPSRLIYVSCDPATLARDLALLIDGGFSVQSIRLFDMFPQTAHVETVVCLYSTNFPP